ncbi:Hypothetical predicted protein [Lecanosticta acicola]|uniref:RING-type domain-containing protein n=1 Tax=Lecanosticta acicola TaxID=111012 RepID=A0AAI8YVQ1_9PEZI|nr:Hypothetical predicted protein [Lecanosticta acicola]
MASDAARQQQIVIDLVSDEEEDGSVHEVPLPLQNQPPPMQWPPARPAPRPEERAAQVNMLQDYDFGMPGDFPQDLLNNMPAPQGAPVDQSNGGEWLEIDGEHIFIPDDIPEPRTQAMGLAPPANQPSLDADMAEMLDSDFTADVCLQRVLAIFPDINHEHVHKLYSDFDHDTSLQSLSGRSRLENIIEKLISGESYPKQDKGKQKKRKREDDEDGMVERWEAPTREAAPAQCKGAITAIIKADFPEVAQNMISQFLATHKHLYQTYVAVANARDTSDGRKKWLGKPSKANASPEDIARNSGHEPLLDELEAARKRVQTVRAKRVEDQAKKRVEEENLRIATDAGETAECQACFEDLPMNRQIHCNGDTAHFTCFECAETYIKSEVGESRCRVLCTAGCGAGFAHAQLQLLADKPLLEKLSQLQQEKDIRDAGLDDLEECPFCDYKAILPPVDVDFEFRCANPECEKVSCRRCKAISHVPQSCEEHAKDNKLNTRHKIEEAMTAAMIRSCNKCKKHFIKDYGCNKMTCPSCGNLQCYVCSQSLKDYNHFDQGPRGPNADGNKRCPLYDNVEERHEREVKEAEAAARAQVMEENPDVSADDLQIKVSDAVSKATQDRIRQAGGGIGRAVPAGFGGWFRMHNHMDPMFEGEEADYDEDFDVDEGVWEPVRARLAAQREERRQRIAGRPRLRFGNGDRILNIPRVDAAARVQEARLANGAAAAAGRPQVQGFIPVFGINPIGQQARPQQPYLPPQPAPAGQANNPGIGNLYEPPHLAVGLGNEHQHRFDAPDRQAQPGFLQRLGVFGPDARPGDPALLHRLHHQQRILALQQAALRRRQDELGQREGLNPRAFQQHIQAARQRRGLDLGEAAEQQAQARPHQHQHHPPLRAPNFPAPARLGDEWAARFAALDERFLDLQDVMARHNRPQNNHGPDRDLPRAPGQG